MQVLIDVARKQTSYISTIETFQVRDCWGTKRKLPFTECLVSGIVLRTFSCGLSQLFWCLLLYYHGGFTSLSLEHVSPLLPFSFCLCVLSLLVYLLILIFFSSVALSFWHFFKCTQFYTIILLIFDKERRLLRWFPLPRPGCPFLGPQHHSLHSQCFRGRKGLQNLP